MPAESTVPLLRRATRWSLSSALLATTLPVLEYAGHARPAIVWFMVFNAVVAWTNVVIQRRSLNAALHAQPANER
jgi:hypothetical protein